MYKRPDKVTANPRPKYSGVERNTSVPERNMSVSEACRVIGRGRKWLMVRLKSGMYQHSYYPSTGRRELTMSELNAIVNAPKVYPKA